MLFLHVEQKYWQNSWETYYIFYITYIRVLRYREWKIRSQGYVALTTRHLLSAKVALTSPTNSDRSRTKVTEFSFLCCNIIMSVWNKLTRNEAYGGFFVRKTHLLTDVVYVEYWVHNELWLGLLHYNSYVQATGSPKLDRYRIICFSPFRSMTWDCLFIFIFVEY
jgi:hypothetical protein